MAKISKKQRRKRPVGRHFRINTATIICLVVFAYLVVRMIMSLMQPTISTYEVTAQRIYDTISTTAMAIRKERVINTDRAGYVIYYVADGERVGLNSDVYAIDGSGSILSQLSNENGEIEFSDDNYVDIKNQIMDYKNGYHDNSFGTVYDFKYALDNNIMEISNDSIIKRVNKLVSEGSLSNSMNQIKAPATGVVSYCYDGMESTTVDTISPAMFYNKDNSMVQIRSNEPYKQGAPVYRLVTSENWDLVIPLTSEQYERIFDEPYLQVKFVKDGLTVTRAATFFEKEGSYFAALDFNKYMERYMDERYVDVEIVMNSIDGLKIPNTSLVKKNLYAIPMEYATQSDETSSGIAFMLKTYDKNNQLKTTAISPPICYMDERAGMYYVSTLDLKKGDEIVKVTDDETAESSDFKGSETYTISAMKDFEGVYTINKGYAQFVVVTKLYQADDFCIADDQTLYGISQFDHVVLNSSSIEEGQIIY